MSQIVIGRVEEILKKISTITKKLDWPDLPIDLNSPIGDFAVVCFPAAKILKKSPAEIASEISLEIKKINNVLVSKCPSKCFFKGGPFALHSLRSVESEQWSNYPSLPTPAAQYHSLAILAVPRRPGDA